MLKEQTKPEPMIENWRKVQLSTICNRIQSGGTPITSKKEYYAGNILFAKIEDVTSAGKYISGTKIKLTQEGLENSAAWLVPRNSLLLAIYGSLGEITITKKEMCTNQAILGIIVNEEQADTEFVYYMLSQLNLRRYAKQSTQANLTAEIIRNIEIPLPPLPEQRAIAQVLSTVDKAIAKVDLAIEKSERLKKGLVQKFFSSEVIEKNMAELKDIFEIKTGTTPSTKNKSYWSDARVNWFTPADLGKLNGQITIEKSERKVSTKAVEETNLNLLPKNSILMSTRAPVGYVAILEEKSAFNQGCKGLLPKDAKTINPYFYAYYIVSKQYNLQNKAGQSTFKEISKDLLKKFKVPVIQKEEQDRITEILRCLDAHLAVERSRKQSLQRIKKGLLNDLLTGKKRFMGVKENVIRKS